MNPADIRAWLASSRDFAQGVALYAGLAGNATYLRLFGLGPSDYARQVLVRELNTLVPVDESPAAAVASPAPAAPAPEPAPAPVPAPVPPTAEVSPLLLDVRRQLRAVRDERSHLHPQLTAKGLRQTQRLAHAARIVALTDQEQELLATEAHVVQHGRLPGPVATADVTEAGELRRRLQNLLSLRSKLKKQPKRANDLAQAEADILLIRSKLNP